MKRIWMVVATFCGTMLLAACTKEIPGTTKIADILNEETYIRVRMGEAYLQEEVTFDMKETGRLSHREPHGGFRNTERKKLRESVMGKKAARKYMRQIWRQHRNFTSLLIWIRCGIWGLP